MASHTASLTAPNSVFLSAGFNNSGSHFAAVYAGLDSHRLRVVPTSRSSKPTREFVFDRGQLASTLCWAQLPPPDRGLNSKKRKKSENDENISDSSSEVVVIGTSSGTVLLYSTASASLIHTLKPGSSVPVCGLVAQLGKLFVLQSDGTFTEFDLSRFALLASNVAKIDDASALNLISPHFVIANHSPNLYRDGDIEVTFPGFATPIKQILKVDSRRFAAIAEEDRQVILYDKGTPTPLAYLTCPSTNVVHVSANQNVLAACCEDGVVCLFDLDRKMDKKHKRIAPSLQISIEVKKQTQLVCQSRFADTDLLLAWAEQGTVPVFGRVPFLEDGKLKTGEVRITQAPSQALAREHLVGGVDLAAVRQYDESRAKVVSGDHLGDLSDDDESLADKLDSLEVDVQAKKGSNNKASEEDVENRSRIIRKDVELQLSQPGSFATLLEQALSLGDSQLLQICVEVQDPKMIKTSISRLRPNLVAGLLEYLATVVSNSVNRADTLVAWMRWTVVLHGAYLATMPNLLHALATLHAALSTQAAQLPRLLALQGRLELLEEQLSMRSEEGIEIEEDDVPEAVYDEIIVNGEEAYSE